MGIQLDYARAKAEADFHRFIESNCQSAPDLVRAAASYLETFTRGAIAQHLRPDSESPDAAVDDFRRALSEAEKFVWRSHVSTLVFVYGLDFDELHFMRLVTDELWRLWNHAVTDFWSQRAEHLEKLGGESLPSAAFAASDTKPSVEPARAEPPTVDGAAASNSSNSERVVDARSTTLASAEDAADLHGRERIPGTTPLSLADRIEIEQQLHQWRNSIWVDINLLMKWSGWLPNNTPPESMKCFEMVDPGYIKESLLLRAFDWDGSGMEILTYDQITATLLKNLQKVLRRYVYLAINLISSKWTPKGIHPSAYASRMESAGEALERDVFQTLRDGVSFLANGESTDSLEQALSDEIKTGIELKIDLYCRDAQLVGLCDLPDRDDAVAESPTDQEDVKPLPGKERKGDALLLAGKRSVSFRTAELYLGITERQRQYLVKDQKLTVEGKGQNKKITTDSLRVCLPPENPN